MNEKIDAIRSAIAKAFPEASIEYEHADSLHKFRLDVKGSMKWLGYGEETFEDNSASGLVDLIYTYGVFESFEKTVGPVHSLIARGGIANSVKGNWPGRE